MPTNPEQPEPAGLFKGTLPRPIQAEDGVSTYLALTFGTLLSSQETDATFAAPPRAPPDVPSRCFQLSRSFFCLCHPLAGPPEHQAPSAFCFPVFLTLPDHFWADSRSAGSPYPVHRARSAMVVTLAEPLLPNFAGGPYRFSPTVGSTFRESAPKRCDVIVDRFGVFSEWLPRTGRRDQC